MDEKITLNILNGQAMHHYFKQHNLAKNGQYAPFNEAMCMGQVTIDIFSDEFNKCRCDAHHITMEEYHELTLRPLQMLWENRFSHIVLWFDDDMFCQINLLTLLAYLDQINYSDTITFNLVAQGFKVAACFKLEAHGYLQMYQQVMIERHMPEDIDLPVLKNGIKLYFDYLKEDNEITRYIKQNQELENDILLRKLLKMFPQYGLGDTQYITLIEKCPR